MATFGNTTIGTHTGNLNQNLGGYDLKGTATKFTLSELGKVTKVSFYVSASSGSINAKAIIYKFYPTIFVAVGSEVSCSSANWYESTFNVILQPGTYYLGFVEETISPYLIYYFTLPGGVQDTGYGPATYSNPNDWFALSGDDSTYLSCYATYIPAPKIQSISTIQGIQTIQF